MNEWDLFAFGANCGNGIDEIEMVVDLMHKEVPDARLVAKSNAGVPQWINNELKYDGTPEAMAEYAQRIRTLGASIIGGCCGSAPEHVLAMRKALDAEPVELAVEARGFMIDEAAVTAAADTGRRRRRRAK